MPFKKLFFVRSAADSQSAGSRFDFVDGLRGILILYVMLHHFTLIFFNAPWPRTLLQSFADLGYLAVRVFFIVSGFLIFHQMRSRQTSKPILTFYLRRFFRIFPLWWAMVGFLWWLENLSPYTALQLASFAFGFTMYLSYWMVIPQAWSLFVEEFFYFFFPWNFRWINRWPGALAGLVVTSLLSWAWQKWASGWGIPSQNYFIQYFPFANLHYFFLGIFYYHLTQTGLFSRPLVLPKSFVSILAQAGAGVYFLIFLLKYGHEQATLVCLLLFLLCCFPGSIYRRLCEFRPLQLFGVNCYALYLIHFALLPALKPLIGPLYRWGYGSPTGSTLSHLIGFGLFAGLTLIISQTLRLGFELPLIRWGRQLEAKLLGTS